MRILIPASFLLGLSAPLLRPVDAQLSKRITQSIKQKVADRKQQLQDSIVKRAGEPVDSALVRAAKPVDSALAKAGAKAGEVVSKAGKRPDMSAEEKRIRSALASGRLDLPEVAFARGKSDLSAVSPEALQTLAKVLADSPNVFLVQGRADAGISVSAAKKLAEKRAVALKAFLVVSGVPAERLFAAGDGVAQPATPLASVLRVQ